VDHNIIDILLVEIMRTSCLSSRVDGNQSQFFVWGGSKKIKSSIFRIFYDIQWHNIKSWTPLVLNNLKWHILRSLHMRWNRKCLILLLFNFFFWKLIACSLFVFFLYIWTHVPKAKTCIKGVKFGACDSTLDLVTVFKLSISI